MSGDYKTVVLVSKKLIRAAQIEGDSVIDPIEMEWETDLLRKAFSVIKSRYQATRVRLILDEDLSHTLDLEIPASTDIQSEKEVIAAKLKTQLPEVLTAGDWDYKVKETKGDLKVVSVFVPVQETYLALTDAAAKEGVELEAVEPIAMSLARDPNPFIGMAKKTDLRGDDEEVLNLQPLYKVEESTGSLEAAVPMSKKKNLNKIFLVTAGLLLFGLLAYGIVTALKGTGSKASPSPSPTPVVATPSPSPTPEPVDLSELKLRILNGSGVPGQAGAVGKLLEKAGFAKADTGNAENYDFTNTIVELKPGTSETAYTEIVKALQPDYTVKKGSPLDEDSEFDVIVTVGKKASVLGESTSSATPKPSIKASASPKPSVSASPSASASASPTASPTQ